MDQNILVFSLILVVYKIPSFSFVIIVCCYCRVGMIIGFGIMVWRSKVGVNIAVGTGVGGSVPHGVDKCAETTNSVFFKLPNG
jgi:hypothetical protein